MIKTNFACNLEEHIHWSSIVYFSEINNVKSYTYTSIFIPRAYHPTGVDQFQGKNMTHARPLQYVSPHNVNHAHNKALQHKHSTEHGLSWDWDHSEALIGACNGTSTWHVYQYRVQNHVHNCSLSPLSVPRSVIPKYTKSLSAKKGRRWRG